MRLVAAAIAASSVLTITATAQAFCGFYVGGADTKLYNNATMVVLMRSGTRTVLSMANNYQGPPEKFAMVVPVPVVLQKENVKTLSAAVFDRVDKLAAPRLVEYWEQDPCKPGWGTIGTGRFGTLGRGAGTGSGYGAGRMQPKVKVEAKFAVGEYQIVILSATEATALEQWITSNGYTIPAGSARYLKPYVKSGSKFFVAKVDPKKVKFERGMAQLSPLRFSYESKDFSLPIRLGLINANKAQDLIVHILAKHQRYEVANYPNATIPTNLIVKSEVRKRFGEFYAALFDATLEKHKNAVVTEYAWDSSTCDPCPSTPLRPSELATLGLDELMAPSKGKDGRPVGFPDLGLRRAKVSGELHPAVVQRFMRRRWGQLRWCWEQSYQTKPRTPAPGAIELTVDGKGKVTASSLTGGGDPKLAACITRAVDRLRFPRTKDGKKATVSQPIDFRVSPVRRGRATRGWVLTRLHARYTADSLGEDLVFKAVDPIRGGQGGAGGKLSNTAAPASRSTFQGRYIIRNPWTGPVTCDKPRRGVWGGRPGGAGGLERPVAARDLAFAKRAGISLTSMVVGDIPGLASGPGTKPTASKKVDPAGNKTTDKSPSKAKETPGKSKADGKDKGPGCGCRSGAPADHAPLAIFLFAALALAWRTRRS